MKAALLALLPAVAVTIGVRFGIERVWIGVCAYHVVCIAVPLLHRLSFGNAGMNEPGGRRWWLLTAAASVVLAIAIPLIGREVEWVFPSDTRALLLRIEPWWIIFAHAIVVNAFLEEYYWRGFLLARTGAVAGAFGFAFMHFAGFAVYVTVLEAALLSLPALAAGLAWGWLRRASGSLWPCVATHAAVDTGIMLLFTAIRRGSW